MKIIAHRGASGYAPENTMAAFRKALSIGVEAIEFDVQMTADGVLIVIHDDLLGRTTNGHGVVIETDYSVIETLDAGSWYDPSFRNERVPLLRDVLTLLKDQVEIHLEIKKNDLEKRHTEEVIYQLVKDMGLNHQVIFSSFDHQCLLNLTQKYDVRVAMITRTPIVKPEAYNVNSGIPIVSYNPKAEYVSPELVNAIHGDGHKIYSFTVNDLWMADYLEEIGVDGIFSNYPDIFEDRPM